MERLSFVGLLIAGFCHKRRRNHSLDAAKIEILGVALLHELHDNTVDALGLRQTFHAMAGLRNDDMSTIG